MVRKGGFEPPRLSAPPPQDGVSASSTTSAVCKSTVLNNLATSRLKVFPTAPDFAPASCTQCAPPVAATPPVAQTACGPQVSRVYVAHSGLNVIVSGDVLQRKGVWVLFGLGQKNYF